MLSLFFRRAYSPSQLTRGRQWGCSWNLGSFPGHSASGAELGATLLLVAGGRAGWGRAGGEHLAGAESSHVLRLSIRVLTLRGDKAVMTLLFGHQHPLPSPVRARISFQRILPTPPSSSMRGTFRLGTCPFTMVAEGLWNLPPPDPSFHHTPQPRGQHKAWKSSWGSAVGLAQARSACSLTKLRALSAELLLLLRLEIFPDQSLPLRNCLEAGPDATDCRLECVLRARGVGSDRAADGRDWGSAQACTSPWPST